MEFLTKEVQSVPSTERVELVRSRYLNEPLFIDSEYIKYYSDAHSKTDGYNVFERRAECHSLRT